MNQITVDFAAEHIGTVARAGEHNETQLIFALSEELRECDFINAEFSTAAGEKVIIDNLLPADNADTLTVPLTQQLTATSGVLQVQLVGYVIDANTAEPQIIAKSPVITGFVEQSINGIACETDRNPSLVERMYKRLTLLWLRVQDLWAERHEHANNRTLDRLRCESAETVPDESGLVIGINNPLSEYLCFNGAPLRRANDGAVITNVTQVTRGGKTYARYWLDNGPLSVGSVPSYFDLPVDSIVQTQSVDSGITLNGIELALPEVELPSVIDLLNCVDGNLIYNGTRLAAERMVINSTATEVELQPNTDYHFGEVEELTITLADGDPSISNEYYFTFASSDTEPVITLPTEVIFANEPSFVANKRYQISIMDNIALWVAVDWAGDTV